MKKWHRKLTDIQRDRVRYSQNAVEYAKSFENEYVYVQEGAILIAFLADMLDKIEDGLLPIQSPTQAPVKIRTIAEVLGFDGRKLAKGEISE